eukprot:CAMPEP_0198132950 /NCGR_PEP_ID=MMETSP1442-20131203/59312_1 /TAXON_ID= /ORGANISM="Craspedostauros australis, Strain CCMP3328" /LENGTH=101 /DNA_ID=CAMNT_0043794053 /DNA_START=495 /DNA_END=800 /DNA_ORIENTATION=-
MSGMMRAFSRSRVVMGPGRADVDLAMTKWWTKKRPAEGQITRTISAHEQHVVVPWLKTFPKKVMERAPTYILYPGLSFALCYVLIADAQHKTDQMDRSHRP